MNVIGAEINGVPTDIAVRSYSNSLLVIVTQTGKVKNCVHVEKDGALPLQTAATPVVYKCSIKFGPDSLKDHAAIQYLCERVDFPDNTFVSLCLNEHTPSTLSAIAEILLKHKNW